VSVNSLTEDIPQLLISQARKDSSSKSAWFYPAVLEVIAALGANGCAILGGDVLHAGEDGTLDHYHGDIYCGNWYIDSKEEKPWADYIAQGLAVTRDYMETYVRMNGDAYWFLPVFVDEQGYTALPGKQE
jgi:hypothetical protein